MLYVVNINTVMDKKFQRMTTLGKNENTVIT